MRAVAICRFALRCEGQVLRSFQGRVFVWMSYGLWAYWINCDFSLLFSDGSSSAARVVFAS